MLFSSASVLAEEKFYRLELGLQAGAAYYMGDLAPYAFMSSSETYGVQARVKIDPRWAVQVKGQRQRVMNYFESENQWDVPEGRYQTPMWHFDVAGEFNFFRFGILPSSIIALEKRGSIPSIPNTISFSVKPLLLNILVSSFQIK